jgi:4-amino-4-deoxy-L-arabinose transferase-like glycosyltransferase
MTPRSARLAAAVVLAVALALRVAHVLTIRDYPLFDVLPLDSESYDAWAHRIASGELLRGRPFYQAPLYAYSLAGLHLLSGGDLLFPRLVNALLGVVNVALVMHLGRRTFGVPVGLLAGALVAIHGTFLFEEGKVMKTTLGLVLAMTTLVLLVEARRRPAEAATRWWAAAGFVGAGAALVRENFLLFVVATVVVAALKTRTRRAALAVAGGAAVGLLPATVHNLVWDGELIPITSQAGQNFYTGSHSGNPHGGYHVPDFVRRTPRFEEMDFAAEANRRAGRPLTPGQISRYWWWEGLRTLAAEPLRGPVLFVRKLGLLYHRLEIPDDEDIRFFRRYAPMLRLPLPGFGLFGVLGLAGLLLALQRRATPPDVILFLLTYSVSVALFFVFSRYRLPLVGPLAIFAAYFLLEGLRAWREGRMRALAVGGLVCVPLVAIVYRPLDARASFANSHLSIGIAYEVKDRTVAALDEYQKGLSLEPDHPKLLRRAARLARGPEARTLLERAVAANPRDVELRFRYGTELGTAGEFAAAAEQFEEILKFGESPPGIHANLAVAYDGLGRGEDASRHARLALQRTPNDAAMNRIVGGGDAPAE